jgi:hypothetical protein
MFFLSNCLPSDIVDLLLLDVIVMETIYVVEKKKSLYVLV